MAYNNNTARQVERVYENDRLKIKSLVTVEAHARAQEKKMNILAIKIIAFVFSIAILSSVYVYSYAAVYATQVQITAIQEQLDLNKSNYTQTLKRFNDVFTRSFVKTYAVENLGFSEYSNCVIYISTDSEIVENYK